jgi:hypothetical protein
LYFHFNTNIDNIKIMSDKVWKLDEHELYHVVKDLMHRRRYQAVIELLQDHMYQRPPPVTCTPKRAFDERVIGRLCHYFDCEPNPNKQARYELAERLAAIDRTVNYANVTRWFENRRASGYPHW